MKKHRSASFTFVQEDLIYLNYIGWAENNCTEQPFETPRATKLCSSLNSSLHRSGLPGIYLENNSFPGKGVIQLPDLLHANLWTVTTQNGELLGSTSRISTDSMVDDFILSLNLYVFVFSSAISSVIFEASSIFDIFNIPGYPFDKSC